MVIAQATPLKNITQSQFHDVIRAFEKIDTEKTGVLIFSEAPLIWDYKLSLNLIS